MSDDAAPTPPAADEAPATDATPPAPEAEAKTDAAENDHAGSTPYPTQRGDVGIIFFGFSCFSLGFLKDFRLSFLIPTIS